MFFYGAMSKFMLGSGSTETKLLLMSKSRLKTLTNEYQDKKSKHKSDYKCPSPNTKIIMIR